MNVPASTCALSPETSKQDTRARRSAASVCVNGAQRAAACSTRRYITAWLYGMAGECTGLCRRVQEPIHEFKKKSLGTVHRSCIDCVVLVTQALINCVKILHASYDSFTETSLLRARSGLTRRAGPHAWPRTLLLTTAIPSYTARASLKPVCSPHVVDVSSGRERQGPHPSDPS
jgi:hypothetical protein